MVNRGRSQPKIVVYNAQRDFPIDKKLIQGAVSFLLAKLEIATDEIIIHFTTDKKISQIHADFFNDPTSTDCITFPIDPPEKKTGVHHVLGECFVCPQVAVEYANKHKIPPLQEVLRYVVHCLLHLIGYDDLTPKERAQMKRKERQCLKMLAEILED